MKELEEILLGGMFRPTEQNCPTREGELIGSLDKIHDIPNPRVGMRVYVENTGKEYVIKSLKDKTIGGVNVPNAAVDKFVEAVDREDVQEIFDEIATESINRLNADNAIKASALKLEQSVNTTTDKVTIKGYSVDANKEYSFDIPPATKEKAGVMSAEDKRALDKVADDIEKKQTVVLVEWVNEGNVSNMNDFVEAGVYELKGDEHTRDDDNLPFANTGSGHTFHARLEVLDSSITPEGKSDDICITQKLTLSNRVAGDGDVYVRTGRGKTYNTITWEKWGKLQQNIEVGLMQPGDLKNLVDNGIYSGIFQKGSALTDFETFVMVVINDYALTGADKRISQFKYALNAYGEPRYESRYAYIEEGNTVHSWTDWEILNKHEISSMITAEIKKVTDGLDPNKIDSIKDIIAWIEEHGGEVEAIYRAINGNTKKIVEEIERSVSADQDLRDMVDNEHRRAEQVEKELNDKITEEKERTEKHLADEVEMLKDGDTIVAQAREIHSRNGKTVTDSFLVRTTAGSGTIGDGVATLKSVGGNIVKNLVDGTFTTKQYYDNAVIDGKIYKNEVASAAYSQLYYRDSSVPKVAKHKYYFAADVIYNGVSCTISVDNGGTTNRYTDIDKWQRVSIIGSAVEGKDIFIRANSATYIWVIKPLLIDLTEMFGAGNEPTKEECDKLFGTMDALPQGLTVANPKEFKSTGYNQADPSKVLANKGIENGAIVDKVGSNLAIVPCLPCKIGEGENNGYCIHGAFDDGAENVYLTPLNPFEVEGELYMHELTKDADKGTYVPQIKGYMLVEVPNATDLCVHFLWSEDRGRHDFEPYYESIVKLPTIPEMPEYGLAEYTLGSNIRQDIINLEKGIYYKRIYSIDLGEQVWFNTALGVDNLFVMNFPSGAKPKTYGDGIIGIYSRYTGGSSSVPDKHYLFTTTQIYIRDSAISTNLQMKSALQGVVAYYASDIVEYPLPKVANNYTSSDYGVEQFDGAVPCAANNLYYMRSLAGETRNFLDRLMAGLGTDDATAVADRILAVVNPVVEPVIEEIVEP